NRGQLSNASRLELGQPYIENNLATAVSSQRRLLEGNGLYLSSIHPVFDYDPVHQQVNIRFEIDSGHRAHFATPVLLGDFKMDPVRVVTATKFRRWIVHTWKPVSQLRVRQGLEKQAAAPHPDLRRTRRGSRSAGGGRAQPARLFPGPGIFRCPGGVQTTEGDQRQIQCGFSGEHRETPQAGGHRHHRQPLLLQRRDPRAHVPADRQLAAVPAWPLQRKPGAPRPGKHLQPLRGERLLRRQIDVALYRRLSRQRGQSGGDAGDSGRPAVSGQPRTGGRRGEVGQSPHSGQTQFLRGTAVQRIQRGGGPRHHPGGVFPERLSARYVRVEFQARGPAQSRGSSFRGARGRPAVRPPGADQPRGVEVTRPGMVARSLQLNPGDPLSPIAITETQRRLYDLGVFAKVDAAVENPDGETDRKYVLYNMEEAARYSMALGLGAELARIGGCQSCLGAGQTGFSARVSLDLARNNLWGLGHSISLRTRVSTLDRRAVLSYNWPRFRNHDKLSLSFTALFEDSRDVRTFSFKREEGSVQLSQRLSKASTVFYRYTYRRVSVDQGTLKITPFLIPLLSQPVRVGMASFAWILDRRDDPVDPHKGIYNTVDVGLAEHAFGSQINFVLFLVRNATYH